LPTLPLCHDCTGVVTLSPPFSTYKYQGRERVGGEGNVERRDEQRGAEIERKKRGKGPNRGKIEKAEGTGRF
jgi:hypothetical protein